MHEKPTKRVPRPPMRCSFSLVFFAPCVSLEWVELLIVVDGVFWVRTAFILWSFVHVCASSLIHNGRILSFVIPHIFRVFRKHAVSVFSSFFFQNNSFISSSSSISMKPFARQSARPKKVVIEGIQDTGGVTIKFLGIVQSAAHSSDCSVCFGKQQSNPIFFSQLQAQILLLLCLFVFSPL